MNCFLCGKHIDVSIEDYETVPVDLDNKVNWGRLGSDWQPCCQMCFDSSDPNKAMHTDGENPALVWPDGEEFDYTP